MTSGSPTGSFLADLVRATVAVVHLGLQNLYGTWLSTVEVPLHVVDAVQRDHVSTTVWVADDETHALAAACASLATW